LKCVKSDDAGDAAACADAWRLRARIESDVREITNERRQCDEKEITKRSQKILNVVAKNKEKIHVAEEVNDSGVQKKRSDKREPCMRVASAGINPNCVTVSWSRVNANAAVLTNIDVDLRPVRQGDIDHWLSTRWTRNAVASLAAHSV